MLETLKNLMSGAGSAIKHLSAAEANLRARLAELDQEEHRLLSQLAPAGEVNANLERLVGAHAHRWISQHGPALIHAASGRVERAIGPVHQRPADALRPAQLPDVCMEPLTFEALAALCPDVLIAGLKAIVAATPYQAGPPMQTRVAALEQIEAQRQTLAHQHAALCDEAAGLGLPMQHLPETTAARAERRRRREAWELDRRVNADLYRRFPDRAPPEPS